MRWIARHPRGGGEDGMTIIEVMVGMVMLMVGVLAILIMVDGGLKSTSLTTAREQATNLARDVIERSREVPYARTATDTAPAALAGALPESPAVSGSSFSLRRRNIDYTVTVSACSIDDPTDGLGVGNAKFCEAPQNSQGPGTPQVGSGLAVGPNILGLPVSLAVGGSLVNTLCNAVGTDTAIANAVSSLAGSLLAPQSQGAVIEVCPTPGAGSVAFDVTPDDLRRVRVQVDWTQGGGAANTLTQTTLLTTPA